MNQLSPEMPKADIALPIILKRTSLCLSQVNLRILALEQQVMLSCDEPFDPLSHTTTLQSFDFIKQATEDIASMLVRVSDVVSNNTEVSRAAVLDPMSLQELRDAIGYHTTDGTDDITLFKGKTVELF